MALTSAETAVAAFAAEKQAAIDNVLEAIADNPFLTRDAAQSDWPDVIVPIHDAFTELCACLLSVAAQTRRPFRLVLIDDGSRDPQISRLLESIHRTSTRIVVIRRRANQGFVRTVNEGFRLSRSDDVVILNSDTVVSPRWLDKLLEVARSRPDVATVTPLTNNGTICSVPHPMRDNELPPGYDVVSFAALVERMSFELFPEAPTGVGFCMLITRSALDRIGAFDEAAFGDGYGEENDFCQRAISAGFVNLIADHTFVYHRGRGSFGARRDALIDRNLPKVTSRHPGYDRSVATFGDHHPLALLHECLLSSISAGAAPIRPIRVLHVLHGGGGTEMHVRDLAAMDAPSVVSYVLRSDGDSLQVEEFYRGRAHRRLQFPLRDRIDSQLPKPHQAYRESFAALCWALDIDVIHVHHLIHHTVDIAAVAADAGIPYLMTLHDYHTVCPSYTLLDPDGRDCRACLQHGDSRPSRACVSNGAAMSLAEYQAAMETFLSGAAQLVVPNGRARDIIAECYPSLLPSIAVVEHGSRRGGSDRSPAGAPRRADDPLYVAIIGGLDATRSRFISTERQRTRRCW
jgi:GT2 family glycosyltransferase